MVHSVQLLGTHREVELATKPGQPLDPALIGKDVHKLWDTQAFADVRVETTDGADGTDVLFRVVEKPRVYLHQIVIQPKKGPAPKVEPGTLIDDRRVQQAVAEEKRQLVDDGYRDAKVTADLIPAGAQQADLRLRTDAGQRYRIQEVRFSGNPLLDPAELKQALEYTRAKRVLHFLWKSHAPFVDGAVDSDLQRLRSVYISHGFLEPDIKLGSVDYKEQNAILNIAIQAGSRYTVRGTGDFPAKEICRCLLDKRRAAEKQGKMGFEVQLQVTEVETGVVTLNTKLDTGPSFTVGRIEIRGNHKYRDATVRRTLLLDEGAVFDWDRLRRSMARVNKLNLFEPVNGQSMQVFPNQSTHRADVILTLKEKSVGRWYFSGPVGPVSIAGPFEAVIAARLPGWGKGLLEMSTYFATLSFTGFSSPLLRYLPVGPNQRFFLVAGLSRPFLPGQWWQSGFTLSPQLGWQGMLMNYGTNHLYQISRNALKTDGIGAPLLPVPVERTARDGKKTNAGFLICDPPKSRWLPVRTAGKVILDLALGNRLY